MKTSVTIQNDVYGLILSLGTGFKGRNEEYRCFKIESVVSKGGYVVNVGMKSSSTDGATYYCYSFNFPLATISKKSVIEIGEWKEQLKKYLYTVDTYSNILKAFDDVCIQSSKIYTTLGNKELF